MGHSTSILVPFISRKVMVACQINRLCRLEDKNAATLSLSCPVVCNFWSMSVFIPFISVASIPQSSKCRMALTAISLLSSCNSSRVPAERICFFIVCNLRLKYITKSCGLNLYFVFLKTEKWRTDFCKTK